MVTGTSQLLALAATGYGVFAALAALLPGVTATIALGTTRGVRAPFRAAVGPMREKYAAGLGERGLEIYNAVKAVTKG